MSDKDLMISEENPLVEVQKIKAQVNAIQILMKDVMHEGEHFGKIPGCGDKPTLLQSGAQKLALMFSLVPKYTVIKSDLPGGHREYDVKCQLYSRSTEKFMGEGEGVASTLEGKFRFRTGPKRNTGKEVPSAYWKNRDQKLLGGPGFSAGKGDGGKWFIFEAGQKVEHDNPADYYNTVKKMACKRAYVAAVRDNTAAADLFTQDLEDMPEIVGEAHLHPEPEDQPQTKTQETPHEQTSASNTTSGTQDPKLEIHRKVYKELLLFCNRDTSKMEQVLKEISLWNNSTVTLAGLKNISEGRAKTILGKLRAKIKALEDINNAPEESGDQSEQTDWPDEAAEPADDLPY